ncbi:hypothetical protein ACFCXP_37110 [Streptomyces niveus]|uniref:hypothetical protein n=1 Tax=Streptomyces niveus TaxID=193462 RepID=UPI0035DB6684
MPATTEPTTDEPETIGSDTETAEPADAPTTPDKTGTDDDQHQGEGDMAEPLDLVGGLLAA